MFKAGFNLSTDSHLDAAIHNKAYVGVFQRNKKGILEQICDGGVIESHCEISVKMAGGYFLKENCVFRIV
ncbi:hypothetical protein P5G65_04665 [Paenibacillus chondroitinus]|uniref:Uncharacterized protein n=1 Tax=Paenibacillus chondroitinus TaxID=59842 RepID=A0ABU6D7B3_9BACL|nr:MULTISPECIES: hypothetical protein [Paenibacillus]MCY9658160.1 hypothetical protein [Paenibacillus anseongense]MEB4793177.1 hypothetical protein [Paenibacillus chondroitinus]